MSEPFDIDKIIFLHLSGEANLEEIQELRNWLNSGPQNKAEFENIAGFWKSSKIDFQAENKDEAFLSLLERINRSQNEVKELNHPYLSRKFNGRWKSFIKVAAAVALMVSSIIAIELGINAKENDITVPEKATVNKKNPLGQKSTIKLPDGSTVWLNAGSSISYPEKFDSSERRIDLKGEAFFDVKRDENRPFVVKVGDINVSVLGTRFNVRAFPEEVVANVSLVSGKVKVDRYGSDSQHESFFLDPGEEISYNEKSGEIVKQKFDIEDVTAWKDGIFILRDDSFASFVQKLERWYGVEVKVEGKPTDNFIVTGEFLNENMENVLRTLQFSRDFDFTIEDKLLTIKFKNM